MQEAVEHLSKARSVQQQQTKTIRDLEEMSSKDEREKLKQQTHEVRWLYKAGWLADRLVGWNDSLLAG